MYWKSWKKKNYSQRETFWFYVYIIVHFYF